jgi:hypothetical protein
MKRVFVVREGKVVEISPGELERQREAKGLQVRTKKYAHTAYGFAKRRPGVHDDYPRVDGRGFPVFESRREVEEFSAKTGGRFTYGDDGAEPDGI